MTPAVGAVPLVSPVEVPMASAGKRWGTVYFDFDQYVVKPEFLPVISEVAGALKANPQARIQLEGHTDRHGSREYNVSLGHRRAEAVRRVMSLHGVPDSQMEAVSFGKEKPASTNSTPDGDALNRRTELQEVR
ncbi:MAG: OmpA family protein [Burkholderiaceae bacterium]